MGGLRHKSKGNRSREQGSNGCEHAGKNFQGSASVKQGARFYSLGGGEEVGEMNKADNTPNLPMQT